MQQLDTHTVYNQTPPQGNVNWFAMDLPLREAVQREGAGEHHQRLHDLGATLGTEKNVLQGRQANRFPPEFHPFDAYGHRIDEVQFHPAYHNLMSIAKNAGMHSIAWTAKTGGHVAHIAAEYLLTQVEAGICCPITMTYAAVPTLQHNEGLSAQLLPKVLAENYDGRHIPMHEKNSLMIGMAMTEKQGGSDVRANTTVAKHTHAEEYLLTGHKWFCSAPMSDGFFTLAQASKGLTCFFVPRFRLDGSKNRFFIQRLKDKLGNHANASSEIEYNDTWALRMGEEGRGVATIIEMVHHTRLDCSVAAVALMRQALYQATRHAQHRQTFGATLIEHPLMQNVLTDLAIEWESNLMLVCRVARAYDNGHEESERIFARIAVAISKYWTNKRCAYFVNEAMECLGGLGYVEDSIMPRLYREAPLNGIWEGSGNVICLDVLRAMHKEPKTVEVLWNFLQGSAGKDARYDGFIKDIAKELKDTANLQWKARLITEKLAIAMQGALLLQQPHTLTEAFLATRMGSGKAMAFGSIQGLVDTDAIVSRIIS